MKKIKAGIVGATGYTARELVRILLNHPKAELTLAASSSSSGKLLSEIHREFKDRVFLICEPVEKVIQARGVDVAFLALPHGASMEIAAALTKKGCKVIDLSPDFRLKDAVSYKSWYGKTHTTPDLLRKAVYGLPELFARDISRTDIVANPGCYATAIILSLAPLLKNSLINPDSIIVDAKSGVSGAGKKLENRYLYSEANENVTVYSVARHRHLPEIEEALQHLYSRKPDIGQSLGITFTPNLVPMTRGILSCAYASLTKQKTQADLMKLFKDFYGKAPFVRLLPDETFPQTKDVNGTNFCDISIVVHSQARRVIIIAAIDNLVKGASGQAVQNMNIMFGLDETAGLL